MRVRSKNAFPKKSRNEPDIGYPSRHLDSLEEKGEGIAGVATIIEHNYSVGY